MCTILSSCNSSGVSQEEYDKLVSELESTKSSLDAITSETNDDTYSQPLATPTSKPTTTPIDSPTKISTYIPVITSTSEFYIEYNQITTTVLPGQPDGFYTYYEAETGNTYVDVCFAYTNKQNQSIRADQVITSAELEYKNQYTYRGFSVIEYDNRRSFTYTNITSISPLTTEYLHYLFEVPNEVESNNGSIDITFTIDGKDYIYTVK